MALDILSNLIADAIFLFLIIVAAFFLQIYKQTKPLRKFFGVQKGGRFIIYLSQLRPYVGGTVGVDGQPRSATAPLVSFGEMEVAHKIEGVFKSPLPFLNHLPDFFQDLSMGSIRTTVAMSPLYPNPIDQDASFISLGSPAYNSASGEIEALPQNRVTFDPAGRSVTVKGIPPFTDLRFGFLERITPPGQQRSFFYAAGLSELSTVGAATYLIGNWRYLQEKFSDDFVIVLDFSSRDFQNPTIISQC